MLIESMYLSGELRSKFYEEPSIYFILAKPDQTLMVAYPCFSCFGFRQGIDKRHCLSECFMR